MSYTLIDLPQKNYAATVSTSPLYVNMGALSAADATTLRIGVVVGAFAGTSVTLTLEESMDAGTSWINVTDIDTTAITGTGTTTIAVAATNGPLAPMVRLKVTPDGGTSVRITNIWRTFVQSNVMVPRDAGGGGGGGGSTKLEYDSAYVPTIRDFSSTGLTANTWSQYIASTSAESIIFQYVNESGYPVELGFGAGGAEISQVVLAQAGEWQLVIPAGTRLSLRSPVTVSSGYFWISAIV